MLHCKIFVYAVFSLVDFSLPCLIGDPLTKVVVGYAAMNGRVSPLWIADEQGFLAKYGLQADQVYIRGAPLARRRYGIGGHSIRPQRRQRDAGGRWRRP